MRLNQIMRGWSNYFKHAVAKHIMSSLENFVWHRVIRCWKKLHRWRWKDVRRHHTGRNGPWVSPRICAAVSFPQRGKASRPGVAAADRWPRRWVPSRQPGRRPRRQLGSCRGWLPDNRVCGPTSGSLWTLVALSLSCSRRRSSFGVVP